MKSKILQDKRQKMLKQAQRLSSQERLKAFFNHSMMVAQLYLSGKNSKKRTAHP